MEIILIVIFILVICIGLLFRANPKQKIGGSGSSQKHKPVALMVDGADYQFWVLQDKLKNAGFIFPPQTTEGIFISNPAKPIPFDYVDYLRIDVGAFTNNIDYRFLSLNCKFMNKFDRFAKRVFVVKHLLHNYIAGESFYPSCATISHVPPGVWIARPSSTEYTPGISTWSGIDLFILYDDNSITRAQKKYAENTEIVKEITPYNEYNVSVIEYIQNPLLYDGYKVSLMMYLLTGAGETVDPFCSINKEVGFFNRAFAKYTNGDYENKDIHYPRLYNYDNLFFPQDLPDQTKIEYVRDQLRVIESVLCPLAQTLTWVDSCRGAYEIFMLELMLDENYRVWLLGVSGRVGFPLNRYDDPRFVNFTESMARWELETAILPLSRGLN